MRFWQNKLMPALFGTERKLRRMLLYWTATGLLYLVCIVLMLLQIEAGIAARGAALALCWYGAAGIVFFFALVRCSVSLRIAPRTLAVLQALFAISGDMWAYAVSGPLRTAWLLPLLLVIVFCTFAMRPRQTLLLCSAAIAGIGATMWWKTIDDPAGYPPRIEALTFAFAVVSLVSITVLTGEMSKMRARLKRQKEELLAAVATIRTLAMVDELTSLANRRHMNELLAAEERRHGAQGQPVCIALLDIDLFKSVNDRYGHAGGDEVLRSFASAARGELRASDMLARWGGEEFLLMLPNTDMAEAARVLRRIAEGVDAIRVPGIGPELRISFSGGLVERRANEPFADTIKRADKALYQAKTSGRARVVPA
jgi:diguanylate cyclase (GGDEF)-like protein